MVARAKDEGAAAAGGLGESAGQVTATSVCDPLPCGCGFRSTALPGLTNRIRDRAMVESALRLPEDGSSVTSDTAQKQNRPMDLSSSGVDGAADVLADAVDALGKNLTLLDLRGNLLAKQYVRVLYGDHGPCLLPTMIDHQIRHTCAVSWSI